MNSGNSNYCSIGSNQWGAVANLSGSVENGAIQFELTVAHPRNVSTLYFQSGFANDDYVEQSILLMSNEH